MKRLIAERIALVSILVAGVAGCGGSWPRVARARPAPKVLSEETVAGTRVTVIPFGASVTGPPGVRYTAQVSDGSSEVWYLGPAYADRNVVANEVAALSVPESETLAEQDASVRGDCVRSEFLVHNSDSKGYEVLFSCLTPRLRAVYVYVRVAKLRAGLVRCGIQGPALKDAKAARQLCATLKSAEIAPVASM